MRSSIAKTGICIIALTASLGGCATTGGEAGALPGFQRAKLEPCGEATRIHRQRSPPRSVADGTGGEGERGDRDPGGAAREPRPGVDAPLRIDGAPEKLFGHGV